MIEATALVQLIDNTAFPIVAFLLMFYLVRTTIAENTIAVRELTRMLREREKQDHQRFKWQMSHPNKS